MNGIELLRSMSDVDNELIIESEKAFGGKKKFARARKWLVYAACFCLCMYFTVPALAANDFSYEIMYRISPQIAQKLKPVNLSSESNGIEMKVIAAEIDGDKANILVEFRDTQGGRISGITSLMDSYSIHTPYSQSGGCSMVKFDEQTKTATFMIEIEQMYDRLIPGEKITFSVDQILSGKENTQMELTQIDLADLPAISKFWKDPSITGEGVTDPENYNIVSYKVMKPETDNAVRLTDGVTLTGYGIVDGQLHVQVKYDDVFNTENQGNVYLKDKNGEVVYYSSSVSVRADNNIDSYDEYTFNIPVEELKDYEIWGAFQTGSQKPVKGKWQVTFPIS